jgi:type II secretory pathway pseudopilin PulG
MNARRGEYGFTMIEIAVIVAIVSFLVAIAVPNLTAYQRRQDARSQAQRIANTLSEARELAIKEGNQYFVEFLPNGNLRIVDDDDNDEQWDAGTEFERIVTPIANMHPDVSQYVPGTSPAVSTVVPEEVGNPNPANANQDPIPAEGITFPLDAVSGNPAILFTVQGLPVSMPAVLGNPPGAPGSGQGTYYVTDNTDVVYAASLSPLGATKLRVFRPTLGDWF